MIFVEDMIKLKKEVEGQMCGVCRKAAFFWRQKPKLGEPVFARMAYTNKENSGLIDGQPILCQFCDSGQPQTFALNPRFVAEFDYESGEFIKWLEEEK